MKAHKSKGASINYSARINFYSKTTTYFEFSNFADSPFKIGKRLYPTVEHFFQSKKFSD